ncbi:MAG: LPS export ABC transporter periplasmic protein LptC [Hyphomicrobiaceae bacterium]
MTDTRSRHARERGSATPFPTAAQRLKAFAKARRHTWLVRLLKTTFPVVATVALVAYGGLMWVVVGQHPKNFDPGTMRIDSQNLTMENPKYDGFGKDGTRYQLRAVTAVTDIKMSGPIRLNSIDGDFVQQTGTVTKIRANWGTFDQKKNELELYEKIDIDGSTGMKARLTRATVYTKENRIVSPEPVVADMPTGSVRARTMSLDSKTRRVTFKEAVEVHLKPNAPPANAEAQAARAKTSALPGLALNAGAPVDIRSDTLDVDDNARSALFRQNVVARQADATLSSPELDVLYEGRAALPSGSAQPAAGADSGTRIKFIKARGGVTMSQKEDQATGNTLDYEAGVERIALRGNVVLTSGAERRVTAAAADFDSLADTALITGNVEVLQGQNMLKGQRLALDRKAGKTRLDSPADADRAAGRIAATFYQPDQKPGEAAKAGSKSETQTETSSTGLALGPSFKTDPKAPINIEAESLDIFDPAKMALFKGNVVARQGDFVVRASELTARYSGQSGLGLASTSAKGEKGQAAQLQKIEARQKVVITSGDGRTASGDWADFNVKANTAVVGGKVIVSQGKSVVEGTKLLIDMNTGQSRFEIAEAGKAASGQAEASPTCPEGQVCSKSRIRAVFYPKEVEAAKKKRADERNGSSDATAGQPSSKQPAASSWQSTTQPPGAK